MRDTDVALAIFALGRFIDYRLAEGMDEGDLVEFKQAYLNLSAHAQGREPPNLHELQAQKVVLSPEDEVLLREVTPTWLPVAEKCALRLGLPRTGPSMSTRCATS